jgi:hypothetical protein
MMIRLNPFGHKEFRRSFTIRVETVPVRRHPSTREVLRSRVPHNKG